MYCYYEKEKKIINRRNESYETFLICELDSPSGNEVTMCIIYT